MQLIRGAAGEAVNQLAVEVDHPQHGNSLEGLGSLPRTAAQPPRLSGSQIFERAVTKQPNYHNR